MVSSPERRALCLPEGREPCRKRPDLFGRGRILCARRQRSADLVPRHRPAHERHRPAWHQQLGAVLGVRVAHQKPARLELLEQPAHASRSSRSVRSRDRPMCWWRSCHRARSIATATSSAGCTRTSRCASTGSWIRCAACSKRIDWRTKAIGCASATIGRRLWDVRIFLNSKCRCARCSRRALSGRTGVRRRGARARHPAVERLESRAVSTRMQGDRAGGVPAPELAQSQATLLRALPIRSRARRK